MIQKTLSFVMAGTVALTAAPFVMAQTTPPPTQLDARLTQQSDTSVSSNMRGRYVRELVVGQNSSVDPILQDRRVDIKTNPQTLLRLCRELTGASRINCMKTGVATNLGSSLSSSQSSSLQSSTDSIPSILNNLPTLPTNCRSLLYGSSASTYSNSDIGNCLRPWISSMRQTLNQLESWMQNKGITTGSVSSSGLNSSLNWYNSSATSSWATSSSSGMSSSY